MTISPTTTAAPPDRRAHPLPVRVGIALVVAVVGNLALSRMLATAVDAAPEFLPLQPGPVAMASVVGVLLGSAVYLLLRRVGRPRWFVPLVAVGALLSLGGPLSLMGATPAQQPGVTAAAALALIPLHLLVGVVAAVVLPSRTR